MDIIIRGDHDDRIDYLPGNTVAVPSQWRGHSARGIAARVSEALHNETRILPDGVYVRFTANRREPELVKSGELRPSRNVRDGYAEDGLSVSEGYAYSMTGLRYCYRCTGTVVGRGADGEPLLDVSTVRVIGRISTYASIHDAVHDETRRAFEAWLEAHGWTRGYDDTARIIDA